MNMMDLVGRTLGNYRIDAPLDSGGMGQVFHAVQIYLNRPAAIKVMRGSFAANPKFRKRFLQEAQAAAALKHPNIVDIYDFGDQDGLLYLVMELMTDGSLRTLLYRRTQGQPWSLSLGLDLVRQAAEGLAAAHEKKVVHRDIKPDNLMLNRQSGQGQEGEQYVLKISDFGLARLAAGGGLTATGATMGTLTYMSPEQCQSGELDGRSDLYSLGIVLYEIAIGFPPFQIDNFEDAYNKHVNTPPPPPRQLRPDLPPSVEEIILRCLAKKPGERYATGTELAQALQRAKGDRGLTTIAPLRLPPMPSALMKSTAFQASGAGGMPPPVVSTLLRPSKVPRVRVLDQSGKTLHVVEVTSAGLTIGRQPRNDIVLDAQGVSRQHLRIQGDSRQVTVTDLGSSNGTWLGEQKLLPQVSQPWTEGKAVRIGPYWLRLEAPNAEAIASMPGTVSQTQLRGAPPRRTQHTASMAGSGRIGMLVEPEVLTITPGQPATTQVTLVNQGSIVDWFTIIVEGVAPEWVQGPAQTVQLNPGMEQAVTLNMNVARTANNRAGDYPVTIRARSREKPDESGTAQARWTVLPFQEDELGIEPRRASGRGKAAYTITMRNSGNIPTHHALSGDDDEQKLAYGFGFNPVALEPGNETKIPLTVSTRRHWVGRERRQPFQIHARPAGSSSPMTAPGEFVNKALIPGWVLPVVGAVLAAAVILGSIGLLRAQGGPTPTPTPIATNATVVGQTPPVKLTKSTATTAPTATPTSTGTTSPNPSPTTPVPQPPPGSSWTRRNSPVQGYYLSGITWSGSQYVAVGRKGSDVVALTSSDGINWTRHTLPTQNYLGGVTWSGFLSMFVAVGNGGTILTSSDGSTWNSITPITTNQLNGVTSSSNLIVAVGNGGTILTSSDGSTWTPQTSNTTSQLDAVTSSTSQYVVVGVNGTILTSPDGTTWNPSTSNTTNWLHGVTSSPSQFVAVGELGTILTSFDGITWTRQNSSTMNTLYAVTSSTDSNQHTEFAAAGTSDTAVISSNGIDWASKTPGSGDIHHSVASTTSQIVVGGDSGTISTSP